MKWGDRIFVESLKNFTEDWGSVEDVSSIPVSAQEKKKKSFFCFASDSSALFCQTGMKKETLDVTLSTGYIWSHIKLFSDSQKTRWFLSEASQDFKNVEINIEWTVSKLD